MLAPQFVIFIENATGEVVRAFTWCRDEASGLARARRDAIEFGYSPTRVWAKPVNVANS